jgi:hypothetical protein
MLRPVPDTGNEPAHRRRYESQSEFLLLAGLGLLALGLGMVALPAERLGFGGTVSSVHPLLWAWRVCGVLVGLGGLALVGYRQGADLDRRERTLTLWRGCFGMRRERVRDLAGAVVTAVPVETRCDGDTYTEYPVELRRGGEVLLELCRPDNQDEAEARAAEMADFLGVPLETEPAP